MEDDRRLPVAGFPVQGKTRAWLIEEADRIANYLRMVHTQLNTCTPISCLPEEILQSIFLHLALSSEQAQDLRWTRITHVCRHWRGVALEYGVLWTCILTFNPSYVAACLQRSANALLRLRCEEPGDRPSLARYRTHCESVALLESHTRRFVSIEVVLGPSNPSDLQRMLTKPWQSLQYLSMINHHRFPWHVDLETILGSDFSKLQSLRLHRTSPSSWILPTFHRLRTLHLSWHPTRPILDELLNFLLNCPNLEELRLINFFPERTPGRYPDPTRTIQMSHLKSLVLLDHHVPYDIAFFLSHLSILRSTRIHIHIKGVVEDESTPLTACLPQDLSTLRVLGDVTAVEAILTGSSDVKFRLRCSRTTLAAAREDPCLDILLQGNSELWESDVPLLDQVGNVLSRSPVHSLFLDLPLYMNVDDWTPFLTSFPSLTTLAVRRISSEFEFETDPTDLLLSALAVCPSSPTPVVPRLAALHLVRFSRRWLAKIWKPLIRCTESRMAMPNTSFELFVNGRPSPLTKGDMEEITEDTCRPLRKRYGSATLPG